MDTTARYAKRLNDQADAINHTQKHAHVGVGFCQACGHYGEDCTGTGKKRAVKQAKAEILLGQLAEAQTRMWDLANELETLLGIEISTMDDLSGYSVADLKRKAAITSC